MEILTMAGPVRKFSLNKNSKIISANQNAPRLSMNGVG
jgi:hypothetical protein